MLLIIALFIIFGFRIDGFYRNTRWWFLILFKIVTTDFGTRRTTAFKVGLNGSRWTIIWHFSRTLETVFNRLFFRLNTHWQNRSTGLKIMLFLNQIGRCRSLHSYWRFHNVFWTLDHIPWRSHQPRTHIKHFYITIALFYNILILFFFRF